jgi:hypothetical protein
MNFIVVKDNRVENLIVADSLENAESVLGLKCIEYDITLVNPQIGQLVENDEVVDLEVYTILTNTPTDEEVEASLLEQDNL